MTNFRMESGSKGGILGGDGKGEAKRNVRGYRVDREIYGSYAPIFILILRDIAGTAIISKMGEIYETHMCAAAFFAISVKRHMWILTCTDAGHHEIPISVQEIGRRSGISVMGMRVKGLGGLETCSSQCVRPGPIKNQPLFHTGTDGTEE